MQKIATFLQKRRQYKYPYIFLAIYITALLCTVSLANRLFIVHGILQPGGMVVFPLTFTICDIVGEVYGYAYPRLFIWIGLIAEFVFSIVTIFVSHLPAPEYFHYIDSYQIVFDPTIRYVFSGMIALLVGEFANIYLLTKWKIKVSGKHYMLRSLVSTALGQVVLTIIVDILNYTGKMPMGEIVRMMICGFSFKMFYVLIMLFPSWLCVRFLKKVENVNYYDINTDFTPFSLSLDEKDKNADEIKKKTKN